MFEQITGFVTGNSSLLVGGGTAGIVLWVLKKVPNQEIANIVETFAFGCFRTMTLGLAKWKFTKDLWNKTIEPYFIDLLENVLGGFIKGAVKGLRSDK